MRCGLTERVTNDRVLGRLDHGRLVDVREAVVHQVELVLLEQRRHDRLHLDVGERLPDTAMAARSERHVAELVFTRQGQVQEPVTTQDPT